MNKLRSSRSLLQSAFRTLFATGLFFLLAACQPEDSNSASSESVSKIRVVTSGGFTAAYNELAPRFEEQTGIALQTEYGASSGGAYDSIPERLARGENFDVVILSRPSLDNLSSQGLTAAGSRTDLVRSRVGMAVRAGAPVPDISTVEKFKQVLLDTSSIGYSASASGTYLSTELWPAMGIWSEIERKSQRILSERVGAVVARGDVDIGFQQISELLPIQGIEFVGPLPDEIQQVTTFSAAITANAINVSAASELIEFLSSPAVAPVITAQGLEAVAGND
ncbi:MAG: substrate-binding domain-containing protein [Gammaproteobacteria bacterium]|nr:substrate-binding domain-containing protein [Gammaproteobacteria bacterium]